MPDNQDQGRNIAYVAGEIARQIEAALKAHKIAFPQENYKSANISLGRLRAAVSVIAPHTFHLGNEETIRKLREMSGETK